MDYREWRFWVTEAVRRDLINYLRQIQSVRIAMSSDKSYENVLDGVKKNLRIMDKGREAVVREDWEDLISQGRN